MLRYVLAALLAACVCLPAQALETPRKTEWDRQFDTLDARNRALAARAVGWPERVNVSAESLPAKDRAFLERLAADTWRGLDSLRDRESGLPWEFLVLDPQSTAAEKARIGDYVNVTSVGMYLIAVVGAQEMGLLSGREARARIERLLDTLEKLENSGGLLYNWYDSTTLERTSDFVSFVDSAWLTAALMVVRQAYPRFSPRCDRLIQRMDYRAFYDERVGLMHAGFDAASGVRTPSHYGLLYAETRVGSLIAIGKGDVPQAHWYRLARTFSPDWSWQRQVPQGQTQRKVGGHEVRGGYYQWQGQRFVPSWGGSMFEALMPWLVLDEGRIAPESFGANARAHVDIQRRYATEVLGYPVWGMSPSQSPDGRHYHEYGVEVLGARGYPAGAVTPHASGLSLMVEPAPAVANLRRLAQLGMYGDFGFFDSLGLVAEGQGQGVRAGEAARTYLVLDQAMMFISLVNHLRKGAIQRHFAADPLMRKALPLMRGENFFE
ncbi:MAG: glucoamylase family protein [Halothiobacillaceae bacterium]|jgi:hypothetical protein|nr:glucoamylase family protein [Halothiobacillaceae bacterium]MDY0049377.1 glucoamylase family protein [Halothiobacillaceae bacterium]